MSFQMCRIGYADFELMQSGDSGSLIERFISRRGEGLHHIAFEVSDVRAAMAHFRERGVQVLSSDPVLLGNLKGFFLSPRCLSGVLVEFIENLHTWVDGVPLPAPGSHLTAVPDLVGQPEVVGFGILVPDIGSAASSFAAVLGAKNSEIFHDHYLGVRACFSTVANVEFKLMEKLGNYIHSPIMADRGRALHHVRLRVQNLERLIDKFSGYRIKFIEPSTKLRGEPQSIFTHPDSFHGVMFELFQSAGSRKPG